MCLVGCTFSGKNPEFASSLKESCRDLQKLHSYNFCKIRDQLKKLINQMIFFKRNITKGRS